MAIIDDHGRLFGRYNLVDALIAALALGLIPLGYGAYVLFRTPAPSLAAVEPATLVYGPNLRVTIRGEHLRPYMRVSFNDHQGMTFLFSSATTAEVDLGDISPGLYDVVLYDYAQERDRLPRALTITPPPLPTTQVDLVGIATGLNEGQIPQLAAGLALPGLGEVLAVGQPQPDVTRVRAGESTVEIPVEGTFRLPMRLRVACAVQAGPDGTAQCVAGPALAPDVYLLLPAPFGRVPFLIDEMRPATEATPIDVRVRFTGDARALGLVQVGDVDVGRTINELAAGATVTGMGPVLESAGGPRGAAREVTLRVPAFRALAGWQYRGAPVRIGDALEFRTTTYQLEGTTLAMPAPPPLKNAGGPGGR